MQNSTPSTDEEMVHELMRLTKCGSDGGASGVRKAIRVLQPTPAQFWRFIRELSEWTVRP